MSKAEKYLIWHICWLSLQFAGNSGWNKLLMLTEWNLESNKYQGLHRAFHLREKLKWGMFGLHRLWILPPGESMKYHGHFCSNINSSQITFRPEWKDSYSFPLLVLPWESRMWQASKLNETGQADKDWEPFITLPFESERKNVHIYVCVCGERYISIENLNLDEK